ncbi:kinase-like domain-containing protein [Roridomyces roridus]|uniref:Kinase-like domain-containing protein n=1 Tax=Roridomyces roridus TaxID=1738132 RepID=A0AAD7CL10_9AGAR|nr:kinase-like domain-containing protein [Roridomyces roridus]
MPSPNRLPNLTGRIVDDGSLQLEKLVGAGSFGNLYQACDTESTRPRPSSWASSSSASSTPSSSSSSSRVFAVKCLSRPNLDRRDAKLNELERCLHRRVSIHPNIVTFHRSFVDDEHEYFVMDFHGAGDMYHAIDDYVYHKDTPLIKSTFAGIVDAVLFCHRQGVYHRDIKPDNILVDIVGRNPRLTDFGLATTSVVSETLTGTKAYMPPESFQSAYYPEDCDAWALSITLINLVTRHWPWKSTDLFRRTSFKQYLASPESYLRDSLPISRPLVDLLTRSLRLDSRERLSIEDFASEVQKMDELFIDDADLVQAPVQVHRAAHCSVRGAPYVQAVFNPVVDASDSDSVPDQERLDHPTPSPLPALTPLLLQPEVVESKHKPGKVKRLVRGLRFWRK